MLSSQNGGAETFFDKLTLALADAGVKQCVVIEPNSGREAVLSAHANIDVRTIRFRGIHEIFGWIRIRMLMRRWQPDIALSWMSRAIKRTPKGQIPIVARLGGYYRVERFRKADRLIGNTPKIVEYLIENGIPRKDTQCIPNFGEVTEFDGDLDAAKVTLRAEYGIPPTDTLLLTLGRLHPSKAHDILLNALALVKNASLLLAGDGPDKTALEKLCKDLEIAERVHFLGWRDDIARLFAASDICVFPSRKEPFGNVVVESWAQRTPLVAADSDGPSWLISPENDALLVPVDDADALAESIEKLRSNEELATKLVVNGYEKYQTHYSKPAIVEQYLTMFREVLSQWKS